MFEFLRKLILPIIIIVLIFFVGLIVLQWGLDYTGRQHGGVANNAGSINGENISWDAYNRIVSNLYQNESQQSEGEVPDSRMRELEMNAWNQLVHDHLLAQEAAKHNITVTDKEVYAFLRYSPPQYLQAVPNFQTDGKFDYQKYVNAMADPQYAGFWSSIEPGIRTEVEKMKMQELVIQTVQVSEPEVKQAFLDANEKVKIGLVNVPLARFASTPPNVSEDEMQQYFNAHKDKYKQEERATLNMVLVERKATEEDWQRVGQKMRVIYDSIKAGADFAEMAKNYSADGSASRGGDLGWFNKGQMVAEFDQRAFSMQAGEVSEPFRTQFGWHIILHQGYRDTTLQAGTPPVHQAHVSHILLRVEPSQEAQDANFQRLVDFADKAKSGGFKETATELGFQVVTTEPFTRRGPISSLGYDMAADSFAFTNNVDAVSDVMENNSAMYVLQVASRLPAGEGSYADAKSQIQMDVRRDKMLKECQDLAQKVYGAVKSGQSMQAAAGAFGLTYDESDYFNRTGYHPQLGQDPIALGAAFSMTTPGQVVGPVNYSNGSAVMMLLDRQTPDLTSYSEKRDSVFNAVRVDKQQDFYNRWFESLVKSSKIENNTQKVSRTQPS